MKSPRRLFALLSLLLLAATAGHAASPSPDGALPRVPSADGTPIAYGSRGSGEPALVLIHCWTCDHWFWRHQIQHFSAERQVIWLDLAGHGQSGSRHSDYTMEAFGDDIAAVVEQVGARQVILVGHSMGALAAVEATKRLGDRVVGVVGVDTFYTPFQYPTEPAAIEALVQPFKEDFNGALEQLVRPMFTAAADPRVVDGILNRVKHVDTAMGISSLYGIFDWRAHHASRELERIAPILRNINGAPNPEEHPPHPSVTLIPGVGHFPAQVKPELFNHELSRIIGELRGTAQRADAL